MEDWDSFDEQVRKMGRYLDVCEVTDLYGWESFMATMVCAGWRVMNRGSVAFCGLAFAIFLTACAAGRITQGAYVNEVKGFSIPLPSSGWRVETGDEADLVLRHQHHQAGILINATCGEIPPDRPLPIISRHLFFGIDGKEILQQETRATAHGEAVEVVLRGELGGRELVLHAYTLRGSGCVYDLVLFAPPDEYSQLNGEFEALVGRFQLLGGEAR